jgi:hypothetical protein
MVVHTCNPSYLGGRDRRIVVQGQTRQKLVRPLLSDKLKAKRAGTMAVVVKCLPSNWEAMGSVSSNLKNIFFITCHTSFQPVLMLN